MSSQASASTGKVEEQHAAVSAAHGGAHGAEGHAAKEGNVFTQLLGGLGDHHHISLDPIAHIPLPYIFWDADGFHAFGSEHSLTAPETAYTTDHHGTALRKDGGPISFDMSVTSNLAFMVIASIILFFLVRKAASASKKSLVPRGIQNLVEVLIVFVRDEIVNPNVEEPYASRLLPYFLTVFFFIITMNLVGLLPWGHTATAAISVTAALALCTFFVTQFTGIRSMGLKHYLLHFTGGLHEMELGLPLKILLLVIMIPIEIMGLFTKPFALAIRLFANMTAGHIVIVSLIGLIFLFNSIAVAPVSVAFSLFIYILELFVAVLQAYVFTMLSAVFIGFMAHTPHEDHDHDAEHPGEHLVTTAHTV